MMRKRYVILDRDGTLIRECHYLSDPDQVELLPGAAEGVRLLRRLDLGVIVVTNQSGVHRGFFDAARLEAVHERLAGLLAAEGTRLDGIYACPHRPDEACTCRKPLPGLLWRAARDHSFDPAQGFVVGDKPCDIELGRTAGAATILVRTGHGRATASDPLLGANYIVADLYAAAHVIRARLTQRALAARLNLPGRRAHAHALPAGGGQAPSRTRLVPHPAARLHRAAARETMI
jgi:D-glycero-D-manno-heptose 1,7-bisphosphate phosphatase